MEFFKSIKKVSYMLGIVCLLLGVIPLPYISQVGEVYACHCGDGVINVAGEECDDGNNVSGDGCSSKCKIECNPGGQELCPTQCGYDGGTVPDGCGGTVTCAPTAPCCTPGGQELCPTQCGYDGGTVPDGCGGTVTCAATDPCCVPGG